MKNSYRGDVLAVSRKALCVAIAAAFAGPALAEMDEEVLRLVKPESHVSFGAGHVSGDNQRFGMFNGLTKEGTYGIGEFSVIRRDDDTGTWFRAQGRNLGLPIAELRLEHERQGSWSYFLEFDQLTRQTPYEIRSRLQGVGTNNLRYPATAGQQSAATGLLPDFKIERLGSKLGFSHFFNPELEFKVVFQNMEKKGERPFGRGTSGVQEFLAEPIDSTTRQIDALLNYTGEKLQLSGGYYGSWFLNANNQLNVAGGDAGLRAPAAPNLPFTPISLPPDNSAHQLNLAGGYQFTDRTRGNFKVAYTRASQTDNFMGLPAGGTNISGRSHLGGRIDTTLAQVGLTSRPTSKLSLLGNLRYEDRDDNTAVALYITPAGYNEPRSLRNLSGKLEASYLLPQGFRLTGGIDAEQKERSMFGNRVVSYREKTEETSYRLELQRALSEAINGSIAYIHSDRGGSGYQTIPSSNLVQPIYMADRDREKIRLFLDWTPFDPLTLQLAVENAQDHYGPGRTALNAGPRSGDAALYSLDASWTLNDRWRLNGWVSRSETRMNQASGNTVATYWTAALSNSMEAFGLGLRGKLTGSVDVGADAILSKDLSRYRLGGAATTSLPDIKYDQTTLKFFGRYAVNKDTTLRLDYIFDHRKTNDWTWNGAGSAPRYTYTDGSWFYQRPEDTVHFFGLSVNYAFR